MVVNFEYEVGNELGWNAWNIEWGINPDNNDILSVLFNATKTVVKHRRILRSNAEARLLKVTYSSDSLEIIGLTDIGKR
jgi:hypothetical protein